MLCTTIRKAGGHSIDGTEIAGISAQTRIRLLADNGEAAPSSTFICSISIQCLTVSEYNVEQVSGGYTKVSLTV
jgi:hypothetical protein